MLHQNIPETDVHKNVYQLNVLFCRRRFCNKNHVIDTLTCVFLKM